MRIAQKTHVEQSFLEAYDTYADAIYRHCYFRVFDREKAEDLMQDTFVRTWEYIQKGESVQNMRALLYRIANNLIIDDVRKKKEASLTQMQEEGFEPSVDEVSHMKNRLEHERVLEGIERLDKQYRDALVLRYIKEYSPAEIAEATGESPNTISVRIYRGLKQLRSRLAA